MITVSNIANASREELLCITYELLLERLKVSIITTGEEQKRHLGKAIEIIKMLACDLDFEYGISKNLFEIYVYVQGVLVNVKTSKEIEEVYKLMEMLHEGFQEVTRKVEKSDPAIENVEQVYAGLTYGNSELNEQSITTKNRGYKA